MSFKELFHRQKTWKKPIFILYLPIPAVYIGWWISMAIYDTTWNFGADLLMALILLQIIISFFIIFTVEPTIEEKREEIRRARKFLDEYEAELEKKSEVER